MALAHEADGNCTQALESARQAAAAAPDSTVMTAVLVRTLGACGQRSEAVALWDRLAAAPAVRAGHLALARAGLGDAQATFAFLESACDERSRFVAFLGVWPIFDRLRTEAGFASLLVRLGLPATSSGSR